MTYLTLLGMMPSIIRYMPRALGRGMDFSRELVAASATPLVLAVLEGEDSYGYEIIRRIRELSDGELDWKEGMLYPLLHRLADQGLIASYDGTSSTGRARKYYRLLPAGSRQLRAHRDSFDLIGSILSGLQQRNTGGAHATA